MKKERFMLGAIMLVILSLSALYGQELDENLKLLEPLTNKLWQSEMQGLRGEGIITSQREWKVVWEGKAIEYTSETEKLDVFTHGFFFWDFDKQEIGVFTINNKGRFIQGHVKQEDGKILMYGYLSFPDKKLEFRNTFEFTEDGKIQDNWYRFEEGKWMPGHSVELYEKKE